MVPNEKNLVHSVELKGNFTHLFEQMKTYIYKMCEIHGIKL